MKGWFLRLHRWTALVFAVPLVLVLATGLILSLEPWLVVRAIAPGSLTPAKVQSLLKRYDPDGKARGLAYRTYDRTLTIGTARGSGIVVETFGDMARTAPTTLASVLVTARRLHETLMIDARWVVTACSIAMLALASLGILMGLPRRENTLPGWHKGLAWSLLPLIVLSPLTGLLMALGITFAGPSPAPPSTISLAEAVEVVGKDHDLSTLVSIRPRGGRMVARLAEGGEYRLYAVTPAGAAAMPRNWPRLWHEGNFAGAWSALLNLVAALAMIGLLTTGPLMWIRRQLQHRTRARRLKLAPAD